MGFFSSRKAEPTPLPASERDSVKVIRSRFYGKAKSAGRASPLPSNSSNTLSTTSPSRTSESHESDQSPFFPGRQVATDTLTMSLAQRLNDLATANADGLLDDDEYRLLRQNVFERFATDSDIPVQSAATTSSNGTTNHAYQRLKRSPSVSSQRSISSAISSLFRRASGRSTLSPAASTSGSIFALQQQKSSPSATDSVSIMSRHSRPSMSSMTPHSAGFQSPLTRRTSDESLMSTSQAGSVGDLTNDIRFMTRRNIFGGSSVTYASSISSRATTRSARPPSSFHRHPALRQTFSRTHEGDDDEDSPKTTAQLREEIDTVESEGRKLLDAFNGLELSALTKSRAGMNGARLSPTKDPNQRRLTIYPENPTSSTLGSAYTLIPDRAGSVRIKPGQPPLVKQPVNLKRKPSVVNSIAGSLKSSTSDLRGSLLSVGPQSLPSSRSSPNLHVEKAPIPALPPSKSVPATISPQRAQIPRQKPEISISPSNGAIQYASSRQLHPGDPWLHALEDELADIRRRRTEVSSRYERRLEFLRAKLKAAEIRERLSRK